MSNLLFNQLSILKLSKRQRTVFATLVLCCPVAFAQTKEFRPFQALGGISAEQSQKQAGFYTQIPNQTPIKNVILSNYNIEMFAPVADLMAEVRKTKGQQVLPSFLISCQDLAKAGDNLQSTGQQIIDDIKNQIAAICRKIERPETIFAKQLEEPSGSMFRDIDSMLEFALSLHQQLGVSFSFFPNEYNQKIRSAMLRIRYPKLKGDFDQIIKNIDNALASGTGNSSQLSAARKLAEKQFAEFMEYNAKAKKLVEQEQQKFGAVSKFDNMPQEERTALTTWLGAVYWRMRGGGIVDKPSGTQQTRLYFVGYAFETLARLNGSSFESGIGLNLMQKLIFKGWGEWMDMGTTPGQDTELNDLINMTARGAYQVNGILNSMRYENITRVSGLHLGSCYIYSWDKLRDVYVLPSLKPPFASYMDGATAWGEYCFGAALGYGISRGLLGP
ncbi:MAG: hypothetical protein ACK5P5_09685 [Pseudobdellovibrionaceae bacterium]